VLTTDQVRLAYEVIKIFAKGYVGPTPLNTTLSLTPAPTAGDGDHTPGSFHLPGSKGMTRGHFRLGPVSAWDHANLFVLSAEGMALWC
jgi:hypothetical protein